ncbi:MAG: tetratricopeptide repeat protein [Bacteroidetes bacterium]|nr:tetratricopeptide repeat protein [Bacteroidota bacterium]
MKKTFLIISMLCTSFLFAQEQKKLDSIQQVLLKDTNNTSALLALAQLKQDNVDTDYVLSQKVVGIATKTGNFRDLAFANNRIGVLYFFAGIYDTALIYFRNTYTIAAKHNLHYIAAKALTNIGQLYVIYDQPRKAIDTLLLSRKHLSQEQDINLRQDQATKTEYLLGETYNQVGVYDESIKTLLNLKKLYDDNPHLKGQGNVLNGLGNTYLLIGDYPKSLQYMRLAVGYYEKENDVLNKQKALYNLGHVYFVKGDLDSSLFWYNAAIAHNQALQDKTQLPFLYELRANIFRDKNQHDSAFAYYNKAIPLYAATGSNGRVGECYYEIGNLFFNNSKYRESIPHYQKAIALFHESELIEQEQNTYLLLAKAETETGNYKQAVQYYQQYDSLKNETISIEKTNAITQQEIKYETSLKEAQIAKQKAEIKLRKHQNYWLLGGASFVTLALITIGFSYVRIRKQKAVIAKQKDEILHNNRNNIQQLISIMGRQGEEEGYKDKATANQERLFTLSLLNKLLYESSSAEAATLERYLEKLCEAKQISYNIPIALHIKNAPLTVKSNYWKSIGLIINELTTNAGKYAFDTTGKESTIDITVEQVSEKHLRIFFNDNGKGLPENFDILASRQSFGLSFIHDLVKQHHGAIKAYNDNGACFEITLEIR